MTPRVPWVTCGLRIGLTDVKQRELNFKKLTVVESFIDLVKYSFKPSLKTLGPNYGKQLHVIKDDPNKNLHLKTGDIGAHFKSNRSSHGNALPATHGNAMAANLDLDN